MSALSSFILAKTTVSIASLLSLIYVLVKKIAIVSHVRPAMAICALVNAMRENFAMIQKRVLSVMKISLARMDSSALAVFVNVLLQNHIKTLKESVFLA